MKNLLLIIFLLSFDNLFALDRFVDPSLSSSNGTTLFTTITSAVNSSANGDRILIVPGTYNEPALTLSKSLTLLSQTAGSVIKYNGNIVITGFPGMKLEILGFDLGIYDVNANQITGGSANNRAKVSFIDCRFSAIAINQDYYEMHCAKCHVTAATIFRFGNFIKSRTGSLSINDEPGSSGSSSILITNDSIFGKLSIRTDNHFVRIYNNYLVELFFWKWNNQNHLTNFVANNDFASNCKLFFASSPPNYNFEFTSNFFSNVSNVLFGGPNGCNGGYDGTENAYCPGNYPLIFSSSSSAFPQPGSPGFFKWTFNGIDLPCTIPGASNPLVLTKITGATGTKFNAGNPNHDYYDIDLTVNDRGMLGGPYSFLNYNPSINPSNGKAYIFDLVMPSDLFPGIQVDINAKGYHRN
ncbi:MAG: hypothetical protein NWQ75_07280 [Schleiferiaceae bacterium]|jgi:hypothetical protein|nr:hypothetical protein [Schleiferiaceae bacterium]MDP4901587.1 hypothetical protein [Schleiferiaceae bacterium]